MINALFMVAVVIATLAFLGWRDCYRRLDSLRETGAMLAKAIREKHERHARDNDINQGREEATRKQIAAAIGYLDSALDNVSMWDVEEARRILKNEEL